MKKLLTLALALVALAAFSGLSAAQQKAEQKSRPRGVEMKQPSTGEKLTGKVTRVDPTAKTFTIMIQGKEVTLSAAKMKALPTVGVIIDLTENPARYKFDSCEACNAVCPGVCFMEGGGEYCRCYLEHLRTK